MSLSVESGLRQGCVGVVSGFDQEIVRKGSGIRPKGIRAIRAGKFRIITGYVIEFAPYLLSDRFDKFNKKDRIPQLFFCYPGTLRIFLLPCKGHIFFAE